MHFWRAAARRLPVLGGREGLPAESMIARAVRHQVIAARNALVHRGTRAGRHPPHHQRRVERLEPFLAPAEKTAVYGLPDEALPRLDVFPHSQVRQHVGIVIDGHAHGIAALVLQPPDEALDLLRQSVHPRDILGEFAHARIVERILDPRDGELGEMADAGHFSPAASAIGSECGLAAYWSMRSSIS